MPRALNRTLAAADLLKGHKELRTPAHSSLSNEVALDSRSETSTSRAEKAPSPPATSKVKLAKAPLPTRIKPNVSSANPITRKVTSQPKPGSSQVIKSLDEAKVVKNRPKSTSKPCAVESMHELSSEEVELLLTRTASAKGKERAMEPSSNCLPPSLAGLKFKKNKPAVVEEESLVQTKPTPAQGHGVSLKRRRSDSPSALSMAGAKAPVSTPIVETGIKSRGYVFSSASPSSPPGPSVAPRSPPTFASSLKASKTSTLDEPRPKKKMRWDMPPPPVPAKCQPPPEESSQPEPISPPAQSTSQLHAPASPPPAPQPELESSTSPSDVTPAEPVARPKKRSRIPKHLRYHAEAVRPELLEPVEGQPRQYDDAIAMCPYECSEVERVLACNRCKVFMLTDR
ncbi:hypothetical protein BJ165DRAFT_1456607 [Panaeolus papilionaceus]|nr:hypothetical protein BJ165DRAFT_1456607 [Panaeolus papilionaceus]